MSSGQPVEVPAEEGSVGEGEIFEFQSWQMSEPENSVQRAQFSELNLLFALKVEKDSVHKEI